jgi:hypothetical protein
MDYFLNKEGETDMANKKNINKFTFFFPRVRVLTDEEISRLSPEKREAAEHGGQKGLWLEIDCPDATCLDDNGRIVIHTQEVQSTDKGGIWLNLFCPEKSCEILQSTDAT